MPPLFLPALTSARLHLRAAGCGAESSTLRLTGLLCRLPPGQNQETRKQEDADAAGGREDS